jgi:hypothetical protein
LTIGAWGAGPLHRHQRFADASDVVAGLDAGGICVKESVFSAEHLARFDADAGNDVWICIVRNQVGAAEYVGDAAIAVAVARRRRRFRRCAKRTEVRGRHNRADSDSDRDKYD